MKGTHRGVEKGAFRRPANSIHSPRLFGFALLAVVVIAVSAWVNGGCPPARFILRYGLSPGCAPTGHRKTLEGVEFVEIGAGCFRMGSDQGAECGDLPGWPLGGSAEALQRNTDALGGVSARLLDRQDRSHQRNGQYEAFDPKHERHPVSPGGRDPVVEVSWEDAKKYCAWPSEQSGLPVRLPAESEWECACRAGSRGEFCFGENAERLAQYARYDANSDGRAHEVGTRQANALGLHDFHGNVWEWCLNTHHPDYEGAPADGTAWIEGGVEWVLGTPHRVPRGGSWFNSALGYRSAYRHWLHPSTRFDLLGFRPAFSLPAEDE